MYRETKEQKKLKKCTLETNKYINKVKNKIFS